MSAGRTLVVGSYPPIPVPSAAATLDAVRRELDSGREVRVLSPRPSAAHYSIPILGPLAGRRLKRAKAVSGCDRLVLCVEPGIPFDPPGRGVAARLSSAWVARQLAMAMRQFSHSVVVITTEESLLPGAVSRLRDVATEVIEDKRPGAPPEGVTVRGPKEVTVSDRFRRIAGKAARRVLGQGLVDRLRR